MTKLVKIGSSYGVRIPKALIDQCKLKDREIDLRVVKNGLLLTPSKARSGWDSEHLRVLSESEELDSEFLAEDLDTRDWEW